MDLVVTHPKNHLALMLNLLELKVHGNNKRTKKYLDQVSIIQIELNQSQKRDLLR